MRTTLLVVALAAVAACSGGESKPAGSTGGANGGGAAVPSDAVGKELPAITDPSVAGCLSKVGGGDLIGAYPLCLQAARIDPENHEVTAALERAKTAYVNAGAQAGAAVQGAQEQAGQAQQQADQMMKGLTPPKLP